MNKWAKVFLVLLRIVIGWHFLYEGVWKITSDRGGAVQFGSRSFLQASVGRLHDSLNGPERLAPEVVQARVDQWQDEIAKFFKAHDNQLSDEQKAILARLGDRIVQHAVAKMDDADGSDVLGIDWYFLHEDVLKLAAEKDGAQYFTSREYLQSAAGPFRAVYRGLIPDADGMGRLTEESARARIDRYCDAIVRHFYSAGHPLTPEQRTKLAAARDRLGMQIAATLADPAFRIRVATYRQLLDRVREDARRTTAPFSDERVAADRKRLDTIAAELLAFVNEPLTALAMEAGSLETVEQMQAGPPPRPPEQTAFLDGLVKWGLAAIGLCLMLGLFTPVAAAAACAQLGVFYFASPPWPGLPAAAMGGHFLYIDRNLIEMIAAALLVTVPAGTWAGLDALLYRCFSHFRVRAGLAVTGVTNS